MFKLKKVYAIHYLAIDVPVEGGGGERVEGGAVGTQCVTRVIQGQGP